MDRNGKPVYLKDIFPTTAEINQVIADAISPQLFRQKYANVFDGNPVWNEISAQYNSASSAVYDWDENSTYIQEPPFFQNFSLDLPPIEDIHQARVLAFLGDSITTDHISPAGAIPADSPAGKYLLEHGVAVRDFNSYGSRRGNDRVMTRGTFANIRLKNRLLPGVEGGFTVHFPDGNQMPIYDAAMLYQQEQVPLIILAGKEYGSGSSRDWAAKGTLLLGVRAVLAESFERIHRSNLVGMGILPMQFTQGENADVLGLDGSEIYHIEGIQALSVNKPLVVKAQKSNGKLIQFSAIARLNTEVELEIYRNGGILQTVLRRLLRS